MNNLISIDTKELLEGVQQEKKQKTFEQEIMQIIGLVRLSIQHNLKCTYS